jgi:hypothetical protein
MNSEAENETTRRHWKWIQVPQSNLLQSLADVVRNWEETNPTGLPDVRGGPFLLLASDYGGQHKASRFETYSYVLVDWIYMRLWEKMRRDVRDQHLSDGRRMAFKDLHDGKRQRALAPFLRAANTLPGILFTVAVNKTVRPTFSGLDEFAQTLSHAWSRSSLERLALISGIASVLIAGLADDAKPGQQTIWVTDEDEILPSKQRAADTLQALAAVMSTILPGNIGDLTFSSTARDDGSRSLEDIAAIADLASGALAEVVTQLSIDYQAQGGPRYHLPTGLSRKAGPVFDWYVESHHPLKRLTVIVDSAPKEGYCMWATNFGYSGQRKECYDWTNDFVELYRGALPAAVPMSSEEHSRDRTLEAVNLLRRSRLAYESQGAEVVSLAVPSRSDE